MDNNGHLKAGAPNKGCIFRQPSPSTWASEPTTQRSTHSLKSGEWETWPPPSAQSRIVQWERTSAKCVWRCEEKTPPVRVRSLDSAFTNRLQVLALGKRGFSVAKNLQSGLRYPERVGTLPPFTKALCQISPFITERHRLEERNFLECGPQWTTSRSWESTEYTGHGPEYSTQWEWRSLPPFWETWRRWLWEHRRGHHYDDALRQLQRQLFKGTEFSLSGWHPWKHMGVAAFRALGGFLTALAIWARWCTPRQAARYAAPPPPPSVTATC